MSLRLECLHDLLLLFRSHASEHGVFADRLSDVRIVAKPGGVHIFLRILDACLPRHFRYRQRVVSGYDAHIDALSGKISKDLLRVLPQRILQKNEVDRLDFHAIQAVFGHGKRSPHFPAGTCAVSQIPGEDQHTQAPGRVFVHRITVLFKIFTEYKFRRAKHKCGIRELHTAVLVPGAERKDRNRLTVSSPVEEIAHGAHRDVIIGQRVQIFSHQDFIAAVLVIRKLLCRNRVCHQHTVVCDRSCLIDTKCVYPGQCLNALHVVKHDIAPCQQDGTCRQSNAHQKV